MPNIPASLSARLTRLEQARREADKPNLALYNTACFRAFLADDDDTPLPPGPRTKFRIWCETNLEGSDTDDGDEAAEDRA